jgi:hypothetical protein
MRFFTPSCGEGGEPVTRRGVARGSSGAVPQIGGPGAIYFLKEEPGSKIEAAMSSARDLRDWVGYPWYIRFGEGIELAYGDLGSEQRGALVKKKHRTLFSLDVARRPDCVLAPGSEAARCSGSGCCEWVSLSLETHEVLAELVRGSPVLALKFSGGLTMRLPENVLPSLHPLTLEETSELSYALFLPAFSPAPQSYVFDPAARSWEEADGGISAGWEGDALVVRLQTSGPRNREITRFRRTTLAARGAGEPVVTENHVRLLFRGEVLAKTVLPAPPGEQAAPPLFEQLAVSSALDAPEHIEIAVLAPSRRRFVISPGAESPRGIRRPLSREAPNGALLPPPAGAGDGANCQPGLAPGETPAPPLLGPPQSSRVLTFKEAAGVVRSLAVEYLRAATSAAASPAQNAPPRGCVRGVALEVAPRLRFASAAPGEGWRAAGEKPAAHLTFSVAGGEATWLAPPQTVASLPAQLALGPGRYWGTFDDSLALCVREGGVYPLAVPFVEGADLKEELPRALTSRVEKLEPAERAELLRLVRRDLADPAGGAAAGGAADLGLLCRRLVWQCRVGRLAALLGEDYPEITQAAAKLWSQIRAAADATRPGGLFFGGASNLLQAALWARELGLAPLSFAPPEPLFDVWALATSPGPSGSSVAARLCAEELARQPVASGGRALARPVAGGSSTAAADGDAQARRRFYLEADLAGIARLARDLRCETSAGTLIGSVESVARLVLPLLRLCNLVRLDPGAYALIHRSPQAGAAEKAVCLLCSVAGGAAAPDVARQWGELLDQCEGTLGIDLPCCWAGLALMEARAILPRSPVPVSPQIQMPAPLGAQAPPPAFAQAPPAFAQAPPAFAQAPPPAFAQAPPAFAQAPPPAFAQAPPPAFAQAPPLPAFAQAPPASAQAPPPASAQAPPPASAQAPPAFAQAPPASAQAPPPASAQAPPPASAQAPISPRAAGGEDFFFDLSLPSPGETPRKRGAKPLYPRFLRVILRLNSAKTDVSEVRYAFTARLPPTGVMTRIAPSGGFSRYFAAGANMLGAIVERGGDATAFLECLGAEVAFGHFFGGLAGDILHTRAGHATLLKLLPKELRPFVDNDLSGEYAA